MKYNIFIKLTDRSSNFTNFIYSFVVWKRLIKCKIIKLQVSNIFIIEFIYSFYTKFSRKYFDVCLILNIHWFQCIWHFNSKFLMLIKQILIKKNKRSNIDETIDENFVRYTVNIQCSFTPSIMKNSIINSRSRIAYLFRLFS